MTELTKLLPQNGDQGNAAIRSGNLGAAVFWIKAGLVLRSQQERHMKVPKEIRVRSGTKVRTAPYRKGHTVVETLRRANIEIMTQCEQGYCGTCMVQLLKGEIKMRVNDALTDTDLDDGMRLACQGEPCGEEVEIELL